ncbi:hypothetical protein [Phreatobacter oligotrophus]|uniref:hypothetical protein n=1 Tax=Phreatobacter oligotrophus TaxID=1122261 RepID=UPI0011B1EF96|nr:hypothetical protein [Phreatobacter oligotrophus]
MQPTHAFNHDDGGAMESRNFGARWQANVAEKAIRFAPHQRTLVWWLESEQDQQPFEPSLRRWAR